MSLKSLRILCEDYNDSAKIVAMFQAAANLSVNGWRGPYPWLAKPWLRLGSQP